MIPHWTALPEAAVAIRDVIRCACRPEKGCKGRFKYVFERDNVNENIHDLICQDLKYTFWSVKYAFWSVSYVFCSVN